MLGKWLRKRDPRPTDEKEVFQHNLLVALSALAQTKDEQVAYVGIGCAVCDLTEDFDTYGVRSYKEADHTAEQNQAVIELRGMISAFVNTEQECFDPKVLERADWRAIRVQAEKALNMFGIKLATLPRPVEREPGVWHTDILAHKLNPL
ncbi:MAG: hypothetical protein IPI55_09190 [Flavobacteriales bacterium]|nr:hypothetical protein [Flavobacteriales bacterium]